MAVAFTYKKRVIRLAQYSLILLHIHISPPAHGLDQGLNVWTVERGLYVSCYFGVVPTSKARDSLSRGQGLKVEAEFELLFSPTFIVSKCRTDVLPGKWLRTTDHNGVTIIFILESKIVHRRRSRSVYYIVQPVYHYQPHPPCIDHSRANIARGTNRNGLSLPKMLSLVILGSRASRNYISGA